MGLGKRGHSQDPPAPRRPSGRPGQMSQDGTGHAKARECAWRAAPQTEGDECQVLQTRPRAGDPGLGVNGRGRHQQREREGIAGTGTVRPQRWRPGGDEVGESGSSEAWATSDGVRGLNTCERCGTPPSQGDSPSDPCPGQGPASSLRPPWAGLSPLRLKLTAAQETSTLTRAGLPPL